MNPDTVPEIEIDTNKGIQIETLKPANQFLLMIDQFCKYSKSGHETHIINKQEFLNQHRIMDAAYQSLQENTPFSI